MQLGTTALYFVIRSLQNSSAYTASGRLTRISQVFGL
jgi:hypothetical protein